mgnify:CR=1 FL=1
MVTTTESIVRQAPYLEDFQKKILESAFARGETPVSIPGIDVAALDPLTLLALQKGQGIGQFQPFLTTGAGTIGQGLATLQDQAAGVPGLFTTAAEQAAGTTGLLFWILTNRRLRKKLLPNISGRPTYKEISYRRKR